MALCSVADGALIVPVYLSPCRQRDDVVPSEAGASGPMAISGGIVQTVTGDGASWGLVG